MADENGKSYFFRIKLSTGGFLGSLIINLDTKFRNSKRWIQYGEPRHKVPI